MSDPHLGSRRLGTLFCWTTTRCVAHILICRRMCQPIILWIPLCPNNVNGGVNNTDSFHSFRGNESEMRDKCPLNGAQPLELHHHMYATVHPDLRIEISVHATTLG